MSTTPETENQLLRCALAAIVDGKPHAADVARFALDSTDEAQRAYEDYQAQQARVVEQVQEFLQGGSADTTRLERAFEALLRLRGVDSHRRRASTDVRQRRRR